MRISAIVTVLQLSLALAVSVKAQVELPVKATMDIYRAGGYNDGSDGIAPVVYSFPARPFQTLTFSSVAGAWTCSTGVAEFGADGTAVGGCPAIDIPGPVGTFGGYKSVDFLGAMVGMFLEDGLPPAAPAALRFYVSDSSQGGIQTDFAALSPRIGQVFFIGDGLTGTGSGSMQVFGVPPTATHLYLGYVDACSGGPVPSCYPDNAGSLTAIFQIEDHELNWVSPSVSVSPPARCCMGMAYDYATKSTLLFGGLNRTQLGDTWSFRQEWTELSPATSPSTRSGPGMTWDGTAGNIVLFGGVDSSGECLNDTWTWDGTVWTQQFPAVSPPARYFDTQGMAYDAATQSVLLFGGGNSASALGDTWTWDGAAKTWTQQFPVASPSARIAAMAYDAVTRTVVLFGGVDGAVQYTDTWTWDGMTWTQHLPATAPPARTGTGMAYDAAHGGVVLFGGYAGIWEDSLNDTWTWNGINWTKMNPATVPPNRYWAGMTYDPLVRGVMMFGGYSSTVTRADSWFYGLVPVSGGTGEK